MLKQDICSAQKNRAASASKDTERDGIFDSFYFWKLWSWSGVGELSSLAQPPTKIAGYEVVGVNALDGARCCW
jgi:hypothetical protein